MVASKFRWTDGRCIEQVTYADAKGLRVEYRVDGLVIDTSIPLPDSSPQASDASVGRLMEEGYCEMAQDSREMAESALPSVPADAAEEFAIADPRFYPAPPEEAKVPVNLAATIRGGYTTLFAFASGAGTVIVDQAAHLGLPPYWTVAITALGAGVGYATKKRIKPDGTW